MLRKLPRFFLLSFFSFCFFTVTFHAFAYAENLSNQSPSTIINPLVAQQAQIQPTPTIYILKPVVKLQTLHENSDVPPSPTPTIYITTPTVTTPPAADLTPTPTIEQTYQPTYNTTEIPAVSVSPTAIPSPTAEPTETPVPPVQSGPVDLDALFSEFSTQYNVSAAELEKIANCESGFNTNSNTGTYAGMYQFLASTWESVRGLMGLDTDPSLRMNPEEAIRTAAFMLSRGEESAWPNCH
jgi:hypothetical protein